MDLKQNCSDFKLNVGLLRGAFAGKEKVLQSLDKVSQRFKELALLAPENDFKDLEANGCRSGVFAMATLIREATKRKLSKAEKMIGFARWYLKWALLAAAINNNNDFAETLTFEQFTDFIQSYKALGTVLEVILEGFPRKLYVEQSRQFMTIIKLLNVYSPSSFPSFLGLLFRKQKRSEVLRESLTMGTGRGLAKTYNLLNQRIAQIGGDVIMNFPWSNVTTKTVRPQIYSTYKLSLDKFDDVHLEKLPAGERNATKRPIRCRVIQNPGKGNKSTLILHGHGGGFISMTPEIHESYTKSYVAKIEDAVVVSVDYTKSPEGHFPIAVQELLDVYLWTLSSKGPLGHRPRKILFTGDSAGAALLGSLLNILADIEELEKNAIKLLPMSFMAIYPVFSTRLSFYPSQILSSMDVIIPAWSQVLMWTMQSPFNVNLEEEDWYDTSKHQELAKFLKLERHPYLSPLYGRLDRLKDVKLYLLTSNTCNLLDQSVAMAKSWKGEVTLDIVDRHAHGFLGFVPLSGDSRKALKLLIKRLQEGLQPGPKIQDEKLFDVVIV